ncbi:MULTISPECIES: FCD domain-containing protein [unclassified Mesorhizobium]|uniref:FadR/GntR family transcriptional regulator n=1 Tax=unclassified Mesorhizobium TaxID=325217 RepID=UPI000FCC9AF8|nr:MULTISPECIES: FCD domain-containing protein [unclassified Mesorhizobium]RUV55206.1 FCD domain-containing protein [Mesorhizobium sp. M5C.F.Ca.IN.020.29.1.1]RWB24238.1 MAG: FCD domain-containing protein [Mesorhizobium sp.]RWD40618.1 MAG: FCD domain-containing protein [Mesorhizobium sp.]RWE69909.1 MAG: FCD domain-containing protein [Mesorhizobium sp.]RWE93918.1 MAG: FCD domain-containing protein [Mesorhizobium sp.]
MSDIFSRIEHSRTADEVVQQIESLILEGVLRTGDRLPGERELARRFEVSRPILRAALKALEGRGLLTTRPGGGTHVADVIGQLFTKPVTDLISMHRKAATDYLEYRREIEAVAAEYAARRATSDDLALLDRIMARMDEAHRTGNFDDEAEIDVEFHHAICECAHNIILLHTLRSCYRLLSEGVFQNRLLVFNVPGAREALLSQHRAIYAAVKAGDPAAARQAAMDHITHVERTMAEAERSGDWQRVSRLRLMQRSEAGDSEPARKRS